MPKGADPGRSGALFVLNKPALVCVCSFVNCTLLYIVAFLLLLFSAEIATRSKLGGDGANGFGRSKNSPEAYDMPLGYFCFSYILCCVMTHFSHALPPDRSFLPLSFSHLTPNRVLPESTPSIYLDQNRTTVSPF